MQLSTGMYERVGRTGVNGYRASGFSAHNGTARTDLPCVEKSGIGRSEQAAFCAVQHPVFQVRAAVRP